MGLFDDEEELETLFEEASIYPSCILDLNEGNVQAIFNRCLATDDTSKERVSRSICFPEHWGRKKKSYFLSIRKNSCLTIRISDTCMGS